MTENEEQNKTISKYGLRDRFAALAAKFPSYVPARIISQSKGLYRAVCERGILNAEVSGKFRYDVRAASDYPTVGDFVMLSIHDYEGNAIIHHVLERKSVFVRKSAGAALGEQTVAANIDTVFICMALNNDFNIRRLERYLSVAWNSGARPVVVLTKSDICEDISEKLCDVESVAFGVDILTISALNGEGIEALSPYMTEGQTVALLGSSGVGKSTLVNTLIGSEVLTTNGLRNDDRGRHTTTHRELVLLKTGAMVIDTPGMRELGLWDDSEGLSNSFSDIEELASMCRFSDCTHTSEPGCAVRKAVTSGELSEERLASYMKLQRENAAVAGGITAAEAKRRKFKTIAESNKFNKKT